MKKLFLLLILSFFSAQSYAGSCPDGSEPVKSISADGTYFVYNCGSSNESNGSANSSTVSNNDSSVWKENGVSENVAMKLSGVGVNSIINFMGDTYYDTINSSKINNNIDKVKQVFNDGFSHFTFVISTTNKVYLEECVELDGWNEEKIKWNIVKSDFSLSCLDKDSISSMSQSLKKKVLEVLVEIPDAVFVISLKPGLEFKYNPLTGKNVATGLNQNIWLDEFEQKKSVRDGFNEQWRLIAEGLKDIPGENLAFNLLNEPEFENFKEGNARETWEKWATETADIIRDISPERTIIIEGIYKSLFARHNGPANVIRPIPRKNIVYGFHYYPNEEWAKQDYYGIRGKGIPMPSLNKPKNDFRQLVDYSNSYKVPVAITEIAVINPCEGYGPLQEDIAKYAEMAYESLVLNGIGMTFWSLESLMSPYQRIKGRCYDIFDKDLIPEDLVFKALRLSGKGWEISQERKKAKQHTVYDGKYSIYLYASYRGKREKNIINATIEINNGLINNSDDSYKWIDRKAGVSLDTIKGTVDKKGNVNWSMKIDPWQKGKYLIDVIFKGNLNEDGSITGNYDDGTALRMKLNKID